MHPDLSEGGPTLKRVEVMVGAIHFVPQAILGASDWKVLLSAMLECGLSWSGRNESPSCVVMLGLPLLNVGHGAGWMVPGSPGCH